MFHHLGWCRTFSVINTNEHICGGKLFILCRFVPLLLFCCRREPQKHSLSVSVLWKGAEPRVLVTLLGSVSRCGAGGTAGKLPPAFLVGVSLPSAGQVGLPITWPSLAGSRSSLRLSALAESPCPSWGGQDLLPRLGNYNQGLLYKGDCFFPSHLMGSGFLLACLTPSPRHFAPGIWYAEHCWDQRGLRSCGCCATKLGWHPDPAMPQVLPRNDAALAPPASPLPPGLRQPPLLHSVHAGKQLLLDVSSSHAGHSLCAAGARQTLQRF